MAYEAIGTRVYWESGSNATLVKTFWDRGVEGRLNEGDWVVRAQQADAFADLLNKGVGPRVEAARRKADLMRLAPQP